MLQQVKFNVIEMNENDVGMNFVYSTVPDANNNSLQEIYGYADRNHDIWKSSNFEEEHTCIYGVKEIEAGIYESSGNFHNTIDSDTDHDCVRDLSHFDKNGNPVLRRDMRLETFDWSDVMLFPYGVADNLDQVKEHFKAIIDSDNPICIDITVLRKCDEDGRNWRWHKWGQYIGTQKPTCEYLYDEPLIEEIILFSAHAIVKK